MPAQVHVATLPPEWLDRAFTASGSVLLHAASAQQATRNEQIAPRSFLFTDPIEYIVSNQPAELPQAFAALQDALSTGHYLAGYATYEAGLALHGLPAHPLPPGEPLLCFCVYREPQQYSHPATEAAPAASSQPVKLGLMPAISPEHYRRNVASVHQWIAAGDIYQANYTFPLRSLTTEDPQALYNALLRQQPSAYAAVVRLTPAGATPPIILSFSPELFVQTGPDGSVLTRPMKGTVARYVDEAEDAQAAAWLALDPKNRAEHVMIVDLLRNDLGRICETGSVGVANLFGVENHPTVHQMVSDVRGQLCPGTTWLQIFRALFPSGSITGAPKLRAMHLLHQVENAPRGVYTGAIGYIAPTGESRFSVAIRTLTLRPRSHQHELTCGVGGGIVADSTAHGEYNEALLKAAFIRRASEPLQLVETVRSDGGRVRWLESHLDRMQHTAQALGFPFERSRVREQLMSRVQQLPANPPQRVRLTLSQSGHLSIHDEPLQPWPPTLGVRLAQGRSHLGDPALAHKTNFRQAYDEELRAARDGGFDEAIFANDAGLVTEGCVTNIFFVRDGRILTPDLQCGVLPGILRTHLLRNELVFESLLPLTELEQCEALLLGNSLRGIYPVRSLQLNIGRTITWHPEAAKPYLQRLR